MEDGPDDGPSTMDDSDNVVIDQPNLSSADPHRTLQPMADIFAPAPSRGPTAKRVPGPGPDTQKASAKKAAAQPDLGPCLFFGPAGERCDRRAVNSGYCSRHQDSRIDWSNANSVESSAALPQISKRAIGAAGIIAVLWPILADLIREILRWLR